MNDHLNAGATKEDVVNLTHQVASLRHAIRAMNKRLESMDERLQKQSATLHTLEGFMGFFMVLAPLYFLNS